MKFTFKPFLPVLVVSILLFITTFLPWLYVKPPSLATFQTIHTENALNSFTKWGILTFVMSLVGVVLSFILPQKLRAIGSIIAGLLALIGVIVYWSQLHLVTKIDYGSITALIVSIVFIAIGFMDYFKVGEKFKLKQPH